MFHQLALGAAARLPYGHPVPGARGQRLFHQFPLGHLMADEDRGRRDARFIKLGDERPQHLLGSQIGVVAREIGAVAVIATAPEEKHLDTAVAAGLVNGDNVGLVQTPHIDVLARLYLGQGADTVAIDRRRLIIRGFAGLLHGSRQTFLDVLAASREEVLGLGHQIGIGSRLDAAHAGSAAALDLIEQTGTAAAREHPVGTTA